MPDVEEVYGHKKAVEINLGSITEELEGKLRPGHFNGVALVVSKLFNIIQPELAFFGQKDVQQFFVIQKLRDALNFNIELEMVPTRREKSGLAMSSRNLRLSQADAQEASLIYTCLKMAKENLLKGTSLKSVKDSILELFESSERLALEYFEAVSIDDFKPLTVVEEKSKIVLCMAAVIGNVRLIDNIPLFS